MLRVAYVDGQYILHRSAAVGAVGIEDRGCQFADGVRIDGRPVGSGSPAPLARTLRTGHLLHATAA